MSWLINRARSALDLDQDQNLMAVIHMIASDLSCHGELYQSEPVFTALDALSGNAADTPCVRATAHGPARSHAGPGRAPPATVDPGGQRGNRF